MAILFERKIVSSINVTIVRQRIRDSIVKTGNADIPSDIHFIALQPGSLMAGGGLGASNHVLS